jgi:hypothetical protein
VDGHKAAITNVDKEHPGKDPRSPDVRPDKKMKNYHIVFVEAMQFETRAGAAKGTTSSLSGCIYSIPE